MKSGFTPTEIRAIVGLSAAMAARMLGFFIVLPIFFFYATDGLGGTHAQAGIAFGLNALAQALLQIPFGILSDRYGRRLVIGLGLLMFIVGAAICGATHDINMLMIGYFLQGAGAVASALFAWVADVTHPSRRSVAMAMLGMSIGAAIVLGLTSATWLYAHIGGGGIFWVCAGLSTVALLVVLAMPEPQVEHHDREATSLDWRDSIRDRELLTLNWSGFVLFFAMRAVFLSVPAMLKAHMAIGQMWRIYLPLGILGGAAMGGGSRMADKGRARSMITFSLALMAIGFLLIGYLDALWATIAGYFAWFAGFSVLEALLPAAVSKLAPAENRGGVIGFYNTSQYLGAAIGSYAAGRLADPHALYGMLTGLTAIGLLGCAGLRRVDQVGGFEPSPEEA